MAPFKNVSVSEVNEMLGNKHVVLVDIRDAASYEQAHIQGAILLDDATVEDFLKNTDKSTAVICYCYHGISSQSAADFFVQNGFSEVYSLMGGFEQWRKCYLV